MDEKQIAVRRGRRLGMQLAQGVVSKTLQQAAALLDHFDFRAHTQAVCRYGHLHALLVLKEHPHTTLHASLLFVSACHRGYHRDVEHTFFRLLTAHLDQDAQACQWDQLVDKGELIIGIVEQMLSRQQRAPIMQLLDTRLALAYFKKRMPLEAALCTLGAAQGFWKRPVKT